jgi:PleD family two-component response regulator
MPWGKVTVEGVVDDDEAKLDVGVRRPECLVKAAYAALFRAKKTGRNRVIAEN